MTTALILAGGLGTRLRSVVADLPKCLAPIGSRPFLDLQIETLERAGVKDVVLSLAYMADKVIESMTQSTTQMPVRWVVEPTLLGTGGAIAHVMDTLGLHEVLVANGDTHLDGPLSSMLSPLDRASGEDFRMAVVEVPDRSRFGGVNIAEGGKVQGFLEKGLHSAGFINAGLYRLHRDALPPSRPGAYSLESDVLPGLVSQGRVSACRIQGDFTDIGVPEDYHRFCAHHG